MLIVPSSKLWTPTASRRGFMSAPGLFTRRRAPVAGAALSFAADYSKCLLAYKMDDADISGTTITGYGSAAANGTLVNTPTTGVGGVINQAITFAGASSEYIDCGSSPCAGLEAITVCAWIKFSSSQSTMLSQDGSAWNTNSYYLYLKNNKPEFEIYCDGNNDIFTCADWYHTGDWVHVAGTWSSGNRTKIFINGEAADGSNGGSARTGVLATGNRNLIIAARPATLPTVSIPYSGTMDDFRIYSSVVSDTNIAAIAAWTG